LYNEVVTTSELSPRAIARGPLTEGSGYWPWGRGSLVSLGTMLRIGLLRRFAPSPAVTYWQARLPETLAGSQ